MDFRIISPPSKGGVGEVNYTISPPSKGGVGEVNYTISPPSKGGVGEVNMFKQNKKFVPYNNSLNDIAKKLRNEMTPAENRLWYEFLRGYKFRFVRQKVIGNYILDFYCQRLKLGIEIDGETHLGDKHEEHDKKRTSELNKLGIKILRFWNNDILYGLGEVENLIKAKINPLNPPF